MVLTDEACVKPDKPLPFTMVLEDIFAIENDGRSGSRSKIPIDPTKRTWLCNINTQYSDGTILPEVSIYGVIALMSRKTHKMTFMTIGIPVSIYKDIVALAAKKGITVVEEPEGGYVWLTVNLKPGVVSQMVYSTEDDKVGGAELTQEEVFALARGEIPGITGTVVGEDVNFAQKKSSLLRDGKTTSVVELRLKCTCSADITADKVKSQVWRLGASLIDCKVEDLIPPGTRTSGIRTSIVAQSSKDMVARVKGQSVDVQSRIKAMMSEDDRVEQ
jgi:hypothetical protein